MAKNNIADLDVTAANNTDRLGQSIAGTANANTIDTMLANGDAILARFYADHGGIGSTTGSTADTYVLTSASTYQALESGLRLSMKAPSANTGACTLNLDGLGAKAIRLPGDTALSANNMLANGIYDLRYDTAYDGGSGAWVLLNPTASTLSAASTTEVLTGTDSAKYTSPNAIAALWEKGSDVASAGTVSLGEGGLFHITGTTTITDIDFATAKDGRRATLIFDGILTLTHNATTLKLPGGANITTAAGDRCVVVQDSSDNIIVESYTKADGFPVFSGYQFVKRLTASNSASLNFDSSNSVTIEAGYDYIIEVVNLQPAADAYLMLQFGTGGTPTYQTSGYTGWGVSGDNISVGGNSAATGGVSLQYIANAGGATAGETVDVEVTVTDPGTSMIHKCRFQSQASKTDGGFLVQFGAGWRTTAEVVTGMRLIMNTGNITSGYAVMFRRKLS